MSSPIIYDYDEIRRPKSQRKKPIVRIRSPYLPFPSGTCKMCWQNHSPVFIPLEHGGSVVVPQSAIPKSKPKPKSLADLFWPSETDNEIEDMPKRRMSANEEEEDH